VAEGSGERELLSAIRASDRGAFERAVALHERSVRRFAAAFLNDAAEGDDVAQRAFLDLWRDRTSLRPDGSLRGVLLARARHLCLNRVRARVRAAARAERASIEAEGSVGTPLDALLGAQDARELDLLRRRIAALVETLDLDARTSIWMRFAGEASFEEIGAAIGRPPHAVRALVYRQLALLRSLLARPS